LIINSNICSHVLDNATVANSTSPERKNPFVLRSASFPMPGQQIPLPPPPQAPYNPLIPHPALYVPSGPFVLKDPLMSVQSQTGPTLPFHMGFPKAPLFTASIPNVASANNQPDISMPNPGAIEAGGERRSLDLGSSTASVSTSDTRGTHSAPILSGFHSDEGFHFPVKSEVQFYKAKIMVRIVFDLYINYF
jgi:hypothetical protein